MARGINEKGEEIVDPVPMELPLGYEYPEPLESILAKVMPELSNIADRNGFDTEEEANDFNVEDDGPDPQAVWEYTADQEREIMENYKKQVELQEKAKEELKTYMAWKEEQKKAQVPVK